MQLVVDANILISFFRFNPVRFIIVNSEFFGIGLFTPEHAIEELKKNESDVLRYSKINSAQFNEILSEMTRFIKIIPNKSFKQFEQEAKQVSPHDKDVLYFALALKIKADIWSNEPRLKRQSVVKVLNTEDLRKLLGF